MKLKSKVWIGLTLILAVGAFFLLSNIGNADDTQITGALTKNNFQTVKIHVEGSNYILEPSTIKKDIPVRLEADISRMPGCSKSVVISAFGVKKSFSSANNLIEFTPNKAGTFNIACSMNMYQGTFTVLESDGTNSNYVEKPSTSGGTCSGDSCGGGCGCGG